MHGRRWRALKTPTLLDVLCVRGRLKLQNQERSLPRVLDSNLRVTASPTRVSLGVASCQSEILSLKKAVWGHQELRRWREFLGIPTYVFEGELFWGQDRLQMLEWHLGIECRRRSARRGCARDRVADDRGTDEKNRRLGHRDS